MDDSRLAHSTFVTALAWVFVLLAGFGALVCLLQSVMVALMSPHEAVQQIAYTSNVHVRDFARFIFGHLSAIFRVLLLVFVATLGASIGLLKRNNAARIAFLGLMGLGILWNLVSLVLMYYFFSLLPDVLATPASPPEWPFRLVRNIVFVFGTCLSIACIGLFWWIARRLLADDVRREFTD